MPFSVVDLEDGVVLVPTKWIINLENGECKCYYPPFDRASKLNEMVLKLVDPELTWRQYDVRQFLKRTDTFEKGREKLLEALVMSEIDSDVVDNYSENYKRSRNGRAKVISSPTPPNASFKDDKKLEKIFSVEKKRQKPQIIDDQIQEPRIPLPPMKRFRTHQPATEFATPGSSKNSEQKVFSKQKSSKSTSDYLLKGIRIDEFATGEPISDDSTLGSPRSSKQSDFSDKRSVSDLLKEIRNDESAKPDLISDGSSSDVMEFAKQDSLKNSKQKGFQTKDVFAPNTSSQKMQDLNDITHAATSSDNNKISNAPKSKVLSNMENAMASLEYQDRKSGLSSEELVLSKLNEIILLLRNIKIPAQSSCGSTNDKSFFDSPNCPNLPINTKKDLIAISDKLHDKNLKIRMINALGSIGGRDIKNIVANVCSKLFTNKVALLYSWSGKKSKLPLNNTNFANLIIRSVKVSCPKEVDHTIKNIGSTWFAQAKTRLTRELAKDGDSEDGTPKNKKVEKQKNKKVENPKNKKVENSKNEKVRSPRNEKLGETDADDEEDK